MTKEAKYYCTSIKFYTKLLFSRAGFGATILFLINILINVDRTSVYGALNDILRFYKQPDSQKNVVQIVFPAFYVVASPFCGYFGDRSMRKRIVLAGMIVWVIGVIGSAVIPADAFLVFLAFRGVVGIGQAAFSNITPAIICDMFAGQERSFVFCMFYLAAPLGSGLGYIAGSNLWGLFNQWQWRIGITAAPELLGSLLFAIWVKVPEIGTADKDFLELESIKPLKSSSIWTDFHCLITNLTYVYSTVAYTTLTFATGSLMWWIPTVIMLQSKLYWLDFWNVWSDMTSKYLLGALISSFGVLGVNVGGLISMAWQSGRTCCFRGRKSDRASSLISAIGTFVASIFLLVAILLKSTFGTLPWVLLCFETFFISVSFGLNVDIIMSVVAPWRRCTAVSWFMLISHLLGDGPGPHIIGAIAGPDVNYPQESLNFLMNSFFVLVGMLAISTVMYLATASKISSDLRKSEKEMRKGCGNPSVDEDINWNLAESRKATISSW